jgi:hypothetical protein
MLFVSKQTWRRCRLWGVIRRNSSVQNCTSEESFDEKKINRKCKCKRKCKVVHVSDMEAYRRRRVIAPLILDLGTRRRWVVKFRPRELYRGTHSTERWLGPKSGLDVLEKRKRNSISCWAVTLRSSSPKPSHYTYWATGNCTARQQALYSAENCSYSHIVCVYVTQQNDTIVTCAMTQQTEQNGGH